MSYMIVLICPMVTWTWYSSLSEILKSLDWRLSKGAFHFNGKTGIASIATVAANGKHVADWRENAKGR